MRETTRERETTLQEKETAGGERAYRRDKLQGRESIGSEVTGERERLQGRETTRREAVKLQGRETTESETTADRDYRARDMPETVSIRATGSRERHLVQKHLGKRF